MKLYTFVPNKSFRPGCGGGGRGSSTLEGVYGIR